MKAEFEWDAFDRLPEALRDFINYEMRAPWSPQWIEKQLGRFAPEELVAELIEIERAHGMR